jgi:hypothetical protein
MKKIKKITPSSVARVLGIMYACLGLVLGIIMMMVTILGSFFSAVGVGATSILFGLGAFIFFPILYGGIGYVLGAFFGWLYNFTLKWSGGVEIELEDSAIVTQN